MGDRSDSMPPPERLRLSRRDALAASLSVVLAAPAAGKILASGGKAKDRRSDRSPAAEFKIDDVIASDPAGSLPDPEFDIAGGRFAWLDSKALPTPCIWVAAVDPATGAFIPADGKGVQVDTDAAPQSFTHNGPEWIWAQPGPQLVYVKKIGSKTQVNRAFQNKDKKWVTQKLPGTEGIRMSMGSQNFGDTNGEFAAWGTGKAIWAVMDRLDATSDREPSYKASGINFFGHWAQGVSIPTLVSVRPRDGFDQIVVVDAKSGKETQLTFEPSTKAQAFMWAAPEFGGDLVVMAIVNDVKAQIWRSSSKSLNPLDGTFKLMTTIAPPNTRPYCDSPEPFVYKGKSYVFFVRSETNVKGGDALGDVYIANIVPDGDGNSTFVRQVSDPKPAFRKDPEFFTYDPERLTNPDGKYPLFIYYTETLKDRSKIIHRCTSGL